VAEPPGELGGAELPLETFKLPLETFKLPLGIFKLPIGTFELPYKTEKDVLSQFYWYLAIDE
jgi:hypothetical protein